MPRLKTWVPSPKPTRWKRNHFSQLSSELHVCTAVRSHRCARHTEISKCNERACLQQSRRQSNPPGCPLTSTPAHGTSTHIHTQRLNVSMGLGPGQFPMAEERSQVQNPSRRQSTFRSAHAEENGAGGVGPARFKPVVTALSGDKGIKIISGHRVSWGLRLALNTAQARAPSCFGYETL